MSAVWESRWAELVRRLAALRETTSLELIQDLMPVLPVVDPGLPELSLLRRERRCAGWTTQAAVAAQQAFIEFRNAAGSGQLVVIDQVLAYPAVGGAALAFRAQPITNPSGLGGANVTTKAAVDSRAGPSSVGLVVGTQAIALPGLEYEQAGSQEPAAFGPYVVGPGHNLAVWAMTANVECNFRMRWRERSLDNSELSPSGA